MQPTTTFNVGSNYISRLAFDASGNLFVLVDGFGRGFVSEFAAGLTNTTPIRTFPMEAVADVGDMLLDTSSNLYIVGSTPNGDETSFGTILEYSMGSSTASKTITGSSLRAPTAMILTSGGLLYVQDSSVSSAACTYSSYTASAGGETMPTSTFSTSNSCVMDQARMTVQ